MQIASSKRPALAKKAVTKKSPATNEQQSVQSSEPKDTSRLSAAHQTGVAKATAWSGKYGNAAGGVIGAALTLPAVYAGLMGGSVAGAVAGLSIGPATGILQGAQGLELIGKVFSTGGTVAKAFMVGGAAAGLIGGWMVGRRVGEYVSAVPLSALAYPVGFAQGFASGEAPELPQEPPKKDDTIELIRRPQGLTKAAAGVLGGVGAISVGLGGAAIGAGAAGGVSLLAGLMAGDVTLASIGSAALIGGGVGVALGGVVGGLGGSTIATTTGDVLSWAKNKIAPDEEGKAIEDLRNQVGEKQENFEQLSGRLDRETDEASADFTRRQKELEQGQEETRQYVDAKDQEVGRLKQQGVDYETAENERLAQRQGQLDEANSEVEGRIEADAATRFAEKRAVTDKKYDKLHKELDVVRDAHQERDDHVTKIENAQAAEIEAKVVDAYNDKMVPVNAHYENLHKEQDAREVELKDWDKRVVDENQELDQQITNDGMADFKRREPGLEREFAGRETELRADYKGKTDAADTDHTNRIGQANQRFRTDKNAADRRHEADMQRVDTEHRTDMREERENHQQAMTNETRRHDKAMNDLDRNFQSRIDRLESGHRTRMAALNAKQSSLQSEKSDLQREKPKLERQLASAERDLRDAQAALREIESRWDREVGQAERDRNSAVSERNSISSELNSTNRKIGAAKDEKSKWVRQKAQVDALIPGLRAERDRLKKVLDGLK